MVKLKIYLTFYIIIACVPQLSGKVIKPRGSQASCFLHRTVCPLILTLSPQRTRLGFSHLRQQISISHGGWSLGPDTSLAITELLIIWLHNVGQISHDRWHCTKKKKIVDDKVRQKSVTKYEMWQKRIKIGGSKIGEKRVQTMTTQAAAS